ncbi:sacsin N-terminal ATP-binding-like domain-containing protein, partial [Runella sp.]|uniref:sacsin N-terminal ATP-binding-like domain-containing protein n=1 Tax=Runella sp. TaxID=1960881 RepID=UPI0026336BF2
MTEQQQHWFDKLAKDREESATMLEKPSMRGIKNSVVEKYSDQAHFIYELLQNANDAKATKSSFQLTTQGLYFKHNGKILFSVSNPDTEDQDKENNTLGHINSITAIANSNKTESSIGKFGVGFKAVFQYTETPHIYDPNFQFKIERFIIPVKLENDLADRQTDETAFYFPFNKPEMSAQKAHSDILEKLKKLVFPTLFLSSLQEVVWKAEAGTGEYTKKSSKQKQANDITYEIIELYQQIGLNQTKENLYLFTRSTEEIHTYSIGYFLDEKDKLTPKQFSAFCFFPTKETTNLNFILHAPFLLTDSREGIHRSKEHNSSMVKLLSKLAADSLIILKELNLITDDIFETIPYRNIKYGNDNFFSQFYTTIKEKLQTEEILPAKGETFANKPNAYWADSPDLANLFTNEQLAELVKNQNAKWVFSTIGRTKDKEITDYIDGGSERSWDKKEPNLIKANMDFENKIADLVTSNFIKNQSNEWLHTFYEYLSERKSYQDKFKTKPIFKDTQENAIPAFEQNGKELHGILFLPLDELNSTYKTIDPELLKNKKTKEFIEKFGIKKPSLKDEIYNHIFPLYDTDEGIDTQPHFELFFKYWKEEGRPEDFINLIRDKSFILYKTNDDETRFRGEARDIYYPTSDLEKYFETKPDTKFVDLEAYHGFITDGKEQQILKEFLLKLGVSEKVRVKRKETYWNNYVIFSASHGWHVRGINGFDKDIVVDGLEEVLPNINFDNSKFIWNKIVKIHSNCILGTIEKSTRQDYNHSTKTVQYSENFGKILKERKWLLNKNREFVAPSEICISQLADGYEINVELERILAFKPTVVLTETERIASKFESEEEAEFAKKLLDEYKTRKNSNNSTRPKNENSNDSVDSPPKLSKIEKTIKDLDDLQNEFTPKQKDKKNESQEIENKSEINFDEEFAKGIEDLKKQLEIKKSRVDLAENINNSLRYSYDWFKAYLQLLTTYGEKQDTQKQKSISFQEIKPYKTDNKYFLLCGASSYISPEVENADDFKVSLVFAGGKRENITVEGVSKKGQDLLIYCREPLSSNTLSRLSNIFKVEINFTPVIDLLDRL